MKRRQKPSPRYPGIPAAEDGSAAIVEMETAASEAAGAYPITPSTQMGEGFAAAMAQGKLNVNGRHLIFFEPEGEHAAAAVTAGFAMTGLRSTNFSSAQGVAYMHESLYAAVGKRLTYVLNVACRAMTKQGLNVHASHDDYHAVDDTGFFQLFAKNVQEAADLNLVSHRVAELSLTPGICAQDGFLTSHVIETMRLPEPELVREFLGDPNDQIESPTPAQKLVFGERRRRIPRMFDYDYPTMLGVVQNQDAYAQGVAAQRPFYFDHVAELTDGAFEEYATLTGRRYARASGYRLEDAEYVIAGQGSLVWNAEAVADHLRETRGLRVGVLNLTMFRPFPSDHVTHLLQGIKAVVVLERVDQPLAVDAPLLREMRAAVGKALENGRARSDAPHPGVALYRPEDVPEFYSGCFGLGSRDLQPGDLVAAVENMLPDGRQRRQFYLGIDFIRPDTQLPKLEIWQDQILEHYPHVAELALHTTTDLNLLPKAGPPREGEPQVRIGEEGPAHDVLRDARAGADPTQLRAQVRGRGARARSQRLPARQSAGRARRRRHLRNPERPDRRGTLGLAAPGRRDRHPHQEDPRLRARRLRDRVDGGPRPRAPLPHAGCGLHGRVLPRGPPREGLGAGRRAGVRGDPQPARA
jgi:pyruvate-ferredoxin/flavodoxin oxidoreductase